MIFLISREYPVDEILTNIEVIRLSVNQLRYCLNLLEATLSTRPIPINTILAYNFVPDGEDGVPVGLWVVKTLLTSWLTSTKESHHFTKEQGGKISNVSIKDVKLNYYFLLNECKLSRDNIGLLPVILLHHPVALREHWKKLVKETELSVLVELFKTPERLLHLLQYYLEKSTNFTHVYVLTGNSSDVNDELREEMTKQ